MSQVNNPIPPETIASGCGESLIIRKNIIEVLRDHLGEYQRPGGLPRTPAVYVGKPPRDWAVVVSAASDPNHKNALEVQIDRSPTDQVVTTLWDRSVVLDRLLRVVLIWHDDRQRTDYALIDLQSRFVGRVERMLPASDLYPTQCSYLISL